MAVPTRRDEAIDDQRRFSGEIGAESQNTWDDEHVRDRQDALAAQVDQGAMLLTALTRAAAVHDATTEFDRLVGRWTDTERRLIEESARRIDDLELRLQREWEALRQLHEEPIRVLEARGAELSKTYADATRAAHDSLVHAQARLDAFEQSISSQVAEAAREFRHAAAALRASTDRITSGATNRAESGVASEAISLTGLSRRVQPLIAGLLCLLIALLIFSVYLYSRVSEAGQRAAAAEQETLQVRQVVTTEIGLVREAFRSATADAASAAARTERVVHVLAAADLQRFELRGERGAPAASGQALWSPSRGLVLTATRLPPAPPGQIGQAWLVTSRGSLSLGFVSPDGQGRFTSAFDAPPELAGVVTGVMVTWEQASGSAKPAGTVLVAS
ncbi:MAG: hypothetical protein A3F70_10105 [Acidobacteria bacterium RIFCSPLOWO2_12_FULL_67_14]|nr:MAG: hypothetical protein A3H29_00320 [Acidobacteria bacterium RIFCSPLOWO2_02_FULL_67_21]OFW38102.1 MAG: hypothetical protein A3F70_10105 [Acidobacteria bacterium RIFCSPLOWO2_12_FULL_67_14]